MIKFEGSINDKSIVNKIEQLIKLNSLSIQTQINAVKEEVWIIKEELSVMNEQINRLSERYISKADLKNNGVKDEYI